MDIEERLLHFPPDAALRAWRLFRVRAEGLRLVLSSPMYHDDTTGLTPRWPYVESEAICYTGHSAPFPGCRCGIYGAVPGTLDSLHGYLGDTEYESDPWAYAEIACHGRVFVDMRGVRAQRAVLICIALHEGGWPNEDALKQGSQMLRDRYGVPVGGMELVPKWVSANVQENGAPSEHTSLKLDLGCLDLSRRGNGG